MTVKGADNWLTAPFGRGLSRVAPPTLISVTRHSSPRSTLYQRGVQVAGGGDGVANAVTLEAHGGGQPVSEVLHNHIRPGQMHPPWAS